MHTYIHMNTHTPKHTYTQTYLILHAYIFKNGHTLYMHAYESILIRPTYV